MPLKKGYSKASIEANIKEMVNAGHSKKQATAAAYDIAKRTFKRKNPGMPLPAHLKRGK